ncbi:MAG: ATP-binding cassette domain-containing protein [Candidatus Lokiarchaeota archaeon]|nr:ATP-binding cassette domain-containing protein [Candidatus Lokiarchaeota archaeon]
MQIESIVERMSGEELFSLAREFNIPITERTVRRQLLIEKLMDNLEEWHKKDLASPHDIGDSSIKLRDIKKNYATTVAVDGLDLDVRPGEIVGLVGPNGAGKTTTLRILTGIIKATAGEVEIAGYDIEKDPLKAKRRIGYIPEKPTCYPSLRVKEYFQFIAKLYDVSKVERILRTRKYVDLFHLDKYLDSYIGTLSKGNLQRVLVVGIFIRPPPFILALDEPIYGLDPLGAWNFKKQLRELRDEGSAILVSTHILEVAEALCDRFVILNHGKAVGRGTLTELRNRCPECQSLEEIFLQLTGGIPAK